MAHCELKFAELIYVVHCVYIAIEFWKPWISLYSQFFLIHGNKIFFHFGNIFKIHEHSFNLRTFIKPVNYFMYSQTFFDSMNYPRIHKQFIDSWLIFWILKQFLDLWFFYFETIFEFINIILLSKLIFWISQKKNSQIFYNWQTFFEFTFFTFVNFLKNSNIILD